MSIEYSTPSLEEEIDATRDMVEARRDIQEIDSEYHELRDREIMGQKFVDEKEQEGKLQILPEEITAEELEIILAFTDSLAEGTGAQYSTVMPSSESSLSPVPALESLKELLGELLKAAAGLLEKLWERISDYWTYFKIRVKGLLNVSRTIRRVAEEKIGTAKPQRKLAFKSGRFVQHLYYNGKHATDFNTLKMFYLKFQKDGMDILNGWCTEVAKEGSDAVGHLTQGRDKDILSLLDKQNGLAIDLWKKAASEYKDGYPLLGGVSLLREGEASLSSSAGEMARVLQKLKLVLIPDERLVNVNEVKFSALRPNEVIEVQDFIIDTGTLLLSFLEDQPFSNLEKQCKNFVRQAQADLADLPESSQSNISALIDYPAAYSKWARTPAIELSSLLLEVSRTLQSLSKESLVEA